MEVNKDSVGGICSDRHTLRPMIRPIPVGGRALWLSDISKEPVNDVILSCNQPGGRVPLEKRWEAGRGEVGGSPHTPAEEADSGSHYAAGWQRLGRSVLGPTHFA